MTVTTKFNLGDSVWGIERGCSICPTCNQSVYEQLPENGPWFIRGPLVVCYISFHKHAHSPLDPICYQFEDDGEGLGAILSESDVYATESEATEAAAIRNAESNAGVLMKTIQ